MLCVSDFSAIEARVLSWLADEKWRMDVFANNGDIYCASASSMFGVPVVKHGINGHLRQKGKVAELALGYQGGPNALISMGALKMGLTEEELPDIVRRWRASNPRIQDFWYAVDNAAMSVMQNAQPVGLPHGIIFSRECNLVYGYDYLTITLPSGRRLFYPQPISRITSSAARPSITVHRSAPTGSTLRPMAASSWKTLPSHRPGLPGPGYQATGTTWL